jgi:hypothetical protein
MKKGHPTLYDKKMKQTAIWMPEEMLIWLKKQGNASEKVRELIAQAMQTK